MNSALCTTSLLAALALASCGGEVETPDEPPATLLAEAFATPPTSGEAEIYAEIQNEGLAGLPIESASATLSGPFAARGAQLPAFDWDLEADAEGYGVDGKLVSTGTDAFVVFFGENYRVGKAGVAALNARLAASGAAAQIDPAAWFENPTYDGSDEVGGADCYVIEAALSAPAAGKDLTRIGTALGLSPAFLLAYRGTALEGGTAQACIGVDDHTVRALRLGSEVFRLEVNLSDLGSEQEIAPPPGGGFQPIGQLIDRIQTLSGFAL